MRRPRPSLSSMASGMQPTRQLARRPGTIPSVQPRLNLLGQSSACPPLGSAQVSQWTFQKVCEQAATESPLGIYPHISAPRTTRIAVGSFLQVQPRMALICHPHTGKLLGRLGSTHTWRLLSGVPWRRPSGPSATAAGSVSSSHSPPPPSPQPSGASAPSPCPPAPPALAQVQGRDLPLRKPC